MWSLSPIDFSEISGWNDDNHGAALEAFSRQKLKPADEQYRTGKIGIDAAWFNNAISMSQSLEAQLNPKLFFEDNFNCYKIHNIENERGQVTGFYEPVSKARLLKDDVYQYPILKRPDDLIVLNDQTRPDHLDESYRFGRKLDDGTVGEYFDRSQIQNGAINHNDLAIAYLADPIDLFFIHIQGAARLELEDGTSMRVTYDGKSGHPFTAIGKLLIEDGKIERNKVSMQSIKAWLYANREKSAALMERNRSYIFFKQAQLENPKLGPIAAGKVPLTAGRSLAVDRLIHTFSSPIFVNADAVNGKRFDHLMIAQETGTAIVGASRGDIFFGSGNDAGEQAGAVNSKCDFTLLVPKDAPFDFKTVILS